MPAATSRIPHASRTRCCGAGACASSTPGPRRPKLIEATARQGFATAPPDLGARSRGPRGFDFPDDGERRAQRRKRLLGGGDCSPRERSEELVVLATRGGELEWIAPRRGGDRGDAGRDR